ncbi:SPOR domain-containing protein [Novosphingobium sp. Gsoil 351]|uniref:SPOR domain-containing protein n=1 Tax=Novosphingobium sp. Gsoil 351 TaxID=2675225 RepID=UPI0012B4BFE6|nr:SPOR domain-containing protein [Novosphingobium sp. Gsoil 351]QGN54518.1 SPOR domain-containing protein [Novosphingobium sp. Gsoil 351]
MTGTRTTILKLASTAAIAVGLLSGCASDGGARPSSYAAKPLSGEGSKAVVKAEKAVLASPRDAAARASLAAAYLAAGRFASAAQSYDDALNLGDESAATVLGLALAETANGNNAAAVELLHDWRNTIPAGDLGLAYALAGEPARGVQVLSDALRNGENDAKIRQNLAFAFALDGRWREARLMVAQDLPADKVSDRIGEWAEMGRPEDAVKRVAHLLGVTPSSDAGQPQALALANFPGSSELAAEAQAQVVAAAEPAAQVAPQPAPPAMAQAELPAVAAPAAAPVAQPVTLAALDRAPSLVASDAPAFATISAPARSAASSPFAGKAMRTKFVSDPRKVAQPGRGKGLAGMTAIANAVSGGSHWVQLGSYTNPAIAKEGWGKFTRRTPALKGYKSVTTTAMVNDVPVWRVAATGFGSYADAAAMCARVKSRGGACLVKRAEIQGAGAVMRGLRR